MLLLSQMARRLVRNLTFEGVIQTILDDVIALLGSERGNVQLPIGRELAIAAQRGFSADFLRAFWRVGRDDGSACGRALRLGSPVVIPDVEEDSDFAIFRDVAKSAGFRAVQSTPLIASTGNLLGVVSTHFADVHMPTSIEMDTLKRYGALAAEYAYMFLEENYLSLELEAERLSAKLYAQTVGREL